MPEEIQLNPNIYTGPDESVDWGYIQKAVAVHQDAERNANRRRGQQTFNDAIKAGVPYADALRQADAAGLFADTPAGYQKALGEIEQQKALAAKPHYGTVRGVGLVSTEGGKSTVLQPEVTAPPKPQNPRSMTIPEHERMKSELADIEANKDLKGSSGFGPWNKVVPDRRGIERAKVYNKYDALLAPPAAVPKTPSATNAPSSTQGVVRPLPKSKGDMIKGMPYQTSKGALIWNGVDFDL